MRSDCNSCWLCVWRNIYGPADDPTLSCGHDDARIRNRFSGYSTALLCKEYLEDDPSVKVRIARETRKSLMEGIHNLAVKNRLYERAAQFVDAFQTETADAAALTSNTFMFTTRLNLHGGSCASLSCYADGQIRECEGSGLWHLGTYKTQDVSRDSLMALGELAGALTYCSVKYLWEHRSQFASLRSLRAAVIRKGNPSEFS